MRKILKTLLPAILVALLFGTFSWAATVLYPYQGGTGQDASNYTGLGYWTSGTYGTTSDIALDILTVTATTSLATTTISGNLTVSGATTTIGSVAGDRLIIISGTYGPELRTETGANQDLALRADRTVELYPGLDAAFYIPANRWFYVSGLGAGAEALFENMTMVVEGTTTLPTTTIETLTLTNDLDVSDDINLTASGGIALSGDDIQPDTGYLMITNASTTAYDNKWDALSDMSLTAGYIYAGNSAGNPQATSSLFIQADGKVGIASTTPAEMLGVQGNIVALGTIIGSNLSGTNTGDDDVPEAEDYTALVAGRSLTKSATSTVDADAETYIFKAKVAFEDPVATDDFFFEELANAVTFTSIYCKTLVGTVDLDVQIAGSDIHGSDITCNTSGVLQEGLGGDTAGAVGEELKLAITSVASSPTYLMVQVNGTYND